MADDHELLRDGFHIMAGKLKDIELVGTAKNGEELIYMTQKLKPDVIITDIKMPMIDGIQATKIIKAEFPFIGVIALSMFDDDELILEMLQAGAMGYLLKNTNKVEIEEAIKAVYNGENYYCNYTTKKLAQLIANSTYTRKKQTKQEFSPREIQVITFLSEGMASKEIADQLNLKTRTIESYRENIMEKMDVKNTAALIVYAYKNGLLKIN